MRWERLGGGSDGGVRTARRRCAPGTTSTGTAIRWCCCTAGWWTRGGSSRISAPLAERFHVYTPERRGHGHTPDVDGPITYQLMADDTIAFLDAVVGGPADLVGHSDGAFVAMLVAMQRPDLVNRLVMISGGFDKSGEAAPDTEFDVDQVVPVPRPGLRRGVPGRRGALPRGGAQGRRDVQERAARRPRRAGRIRPARW